MSSVSMKKRLIILIVIIVVLVVAILLVVKPWGDNPIGGGTNAAGTEEIQNDGLVIEDSATVEVDIDGDKKASKKDAED
jgi:flagellar basal body-associated protein FliL